MNTGIIGSMFGMRVVADANVPRFRIVQFRFPKTKRKRVRKKFAKIEANFKQVPNKSAYVLNGNTLVCHPDDLHAIQGLATAR